MCHCPLRWDMVQAMPQPSFLQDHWVFMRTSGVFYCCLPVLCSHSEHLYSLYSPDEDSCQKFVPFIGVRLCSVVCGRLKLTCSLFHSALQWNTFIFVTGCESWDCRAEPLNLRYEWVENDFFSLRCDLSGLCVQHSPVDCICRGRNLTKHFSLATDSDRERRKWLRLYYCYMIVMIILLQC